MIDTTLVRVYKLQEELIKEMGLKEEEEVNRLMGRKWYKLWLFPLNQNPTHKTVREVRYRFHYTDRIIYLKQLKERAENPAVDKITIDEVGMDYLDG